MEFQDFFNNSDDFDGDEFDISDEDFERYAPRQSIGIISSVAPVELNLETKDPNDIKMTENPTVFNAWIRDPYMSVTFIDGSTMKLIGDEMVRIYYDRPQYVPDENSANCTMFQPLFLRMFLNVFTVLPNGVANWCQMVREVNDIRARYGLRPIDPKFPDYRWLPTVQHIDRNVKILYYIEPDMLKEKK